MLVLSLGATFALALAQRPLAAQDLSAVGTQPDAQQVHLDLETHAGPLRATAFGPGAIAHPPSSPGPAQRGLGSFFPLGVGAEGDQPLDVEYALGGSVVVSCLRDTNTLEFHDATSGALLGRLDVPAEPTDLDVVPDGSSVLVASRTADRVTVVDVATRSIVREIPVSTAPYRVVALGDGLRAVVGCDRSTGSGAFDVIDWTSGAVLRTIGTPSQGPLGITYSPWFGVQREILSEFDVTPDDGRIVFASRAAQSILVYDIATGATEHVEGPLDTVPNRLAIAPSGSFCVVSATNFFAPQNELTLLDLGSYAARPLAVGGQFFLSDILVLPAEQRLLVGAIGGAIEVDVASGQILQQLAAGEAIADIELTHDSAHALVSRAGFAVVDVSTLAIEAEIPGDLFPRIAVHPSQKRAATVTPSGGESVSAATTSGATAQPLWSTELGDPVEIDAPYALALTPDQDTVVAACPVSRNLTIADVWSGALQGTIPLGAACHALAVAADGRQVVCSLDESNEVVVADLALGQVVARLPVGGTPNDVFITADGSTAIVRAQVGADGVLLALDLAGAATTITGSVTVPGAFWFGAALSPNDSILACVGGLGVTLIDVPALTIRATVPGNPTSVAGFWSSDSTKFGWPADLFHIDVATIGAGGVTLQRVSQPTDLVLRGAFDESADFVYMLVGGQRLKVFDLASGSQVRNIAIPGLQPAITYYPTWATRIGDQLLTARTEFNAAVTRFRMDGPNTELIEHIALEDEGTYGIAFAHESGRVIVPASIRGDGLRVLEYGGSQTTRCTPAAPNSTGVPGEIRATGPLVAGDVPVGLEASSLPPSSFGFFLVSRTPGMFQPPNGQGTICLGGTIGRILDSAASTGSAGSLRYELDLADLPLPPPVIVAPGDSLYFQAWHRDANPGVTSNLTTSVQVTFR
ncbi:MAG: hypothetical protein AAGI22_17545 [Planctomycetota bacterium]